MARKLQIVPDMRYMKNGTYMVISKFAYLIGVPFHIFENEHEPPKMEWYEALEKDKNARIIRNLCMLRTAFERNYRNIYQAMRYDLKGIASMPEYIPRECIDQLSADGLSSYRANAQPIQYIIDINSHIANRINNCKEPFPHLAELVLHPPTVYHARRYNGERRQRRCC